MSDYITNPLGANASNMEDTGTLADNDVEIVTAHVTVDNPGDIVFGTVTADQGDAGADPWPIKIDQTTPGTTNGVQVNAALPAGTNSIGSVKDNGVAWTVTQTTTASSDMSTAAAISVAPTAGQHLVADDVIIFSDTAMSFKLQEETSATVLATVFLAANGSAQVTLRDGLTVPTVNKRLFGKASVSGNVSILVNQHSAP